MTEPVHRALAAARRPLARPELRLERSLPEHRRILARDRRRRPATAARAAMRDHLLTVERYLPEYAARTAGRPTPRRGAGRERDRGVLRQPRDAGARGPRVRPVDRDPASPTSCRCIRARPAGCSTAWSMTAGSSAATARARPTRRRCGSSRSPRSSRSARRWSATRRRSRARPARGDRATPCTSPSRATGRRCAWCARRRGGRRSRAARPRARPRDRGGQAPARPSGRRGARPCCFAAGAVTERTLAEPVALPRRSRPRA